MWNLKKKKNQQTNEYSKKEQTHRYREQTSGDQCREEGQYRGGGVRGAYYQV